MGKLIYEMIPMLLSLGVSQIAYLKVDKKYGISDKISSKIRVKDKWKSFFCFSCTMLIILSFWIIDMYVIDIPQTIYSILNGIVIGIGIGMSNQMLILKNK